MILLCSDDPTTSYTAAWPLSSRGDYLTHLLVTNIVPLLPWISRVRRCMFRFSGSCHGRAGSRVTRWILFFTWIRPWFLPIIQFKAPFNLYSVDINDLVTVALADLVNQVVVFFLQIVYVRAATLDVPKQAVCFVVQHAYPLFHPTLIRVIKRVFMFFVENLLHEVKLLTQISKLPRHLHLSNEHLQ